MYAEGIGVKGEMGVDFHTKRAILVFGVAHPPHTLGSHTVNTLYEFPC